MVGRVWGASAVVAAASALMVAGGGGWPAHADDSAAPGDSSWLVGRWVPVSGAGAHSPRPPFIQFAADGRWTGSDGCNGQAGGWTVARDGGFRATAGPSTMMACDGEPVGTWMRSAARAESLGGELVLRNAAGVEQGRLRRAG